MAPCYFTYIDRVSGDDVVVVLAEQLEQAPRFWGAIGEEKSRHRYAPGKWSIRETLGHVNDTERVFLFRTFWFARGFGAAPAELRAGRRGGHGRGADERTLESLLEEFLAIRRSGLELVRTSPARRLAAARHRQRQPVPGARRRVRDGGPRGAPRRGS